ncbi:MAG: hypothetical protein HUK22_07615 [Thermoguttaceae bacterium]|nr:hypothetical protein [Thermoguttaceae bacterium]
MFVRSSGLLSECECGRTLLVAFALILVKNWDAVTRLRIPFIVGGCLLCGYFAITELYSCLVGAAALALGTPLALYASGEARRIGLGWTLALTAACAALIYVFVYLPNAPYRDGGDLSALRFYAKASLQNWERYIFGIGGGAFDVYAEAIGGTTDVWAVFKPFIELGVAGLALIAFILTQCWRDFGFRLTKNPAWLPLAAFLGAEFAQGSLGGASLCALTLLCVLPIHSSAPKIILRSIIDDDVEK